MTNLKQEIKFAKEILIKKGEFLPSIHIEGSKAGSTGVFADFPDTHGSKLALMFQAGCEMAKIKDKIGKLKEVYFISEAWAGTKADIRPSQDSERKEVLIVTQLKNKKIKGVILEIKRNKSNKVIDLEAIPDMKPSEVKSPLIEAFIAGWVKNDPGAIAPTATA